MALALRAVDSNISGVNQKAEEIIVTTCIVNQLAKKPDFMSKLNNFCCIWKATCFDLASLLSDCFDKKVAINFPEGRRLKREAGHLPPYSSDVKNEWSYNSAPYLPPWCGQGKFNFNFFIMTCYFTSKHADFAVEHKETITEVVFEIRCACLWEIRHSKPQDTVSISNSYQLQIIMNHQP